MLTAKALSRQKKDIACIMNVFFKDVEAEDDGTELMRAREAPPCVGSSSTSKASVETRMRARNTSQSVSGIVISSGSEEEAIPVSAERGASYAIS